MKVKEFFHFLLIAVLLFSTAAVAENQKIPSPKEFFGFQMGSDGNLAGWQKMLDYFNVLDKASDRVMVKTLGKSTLGNTFVVVIFSAPGNLAELEKFRKISKKLADPRGLDDAAIQKLIDEGKYVSAQSYSLHATEVGGIQCTPELAYDLATGNDPTTKMILENTIFLMVPSFNPDGAIMVKEWFDKYKGTEFDNTRLPYLYHFYIGHDNNRDSYQLTQNESRMHAQLIYRDWVPQSYVDHHHFGSRGARFYIPPYRDPIHDNVNPLIWREHQLYGAHMAVALDNEGKSGIESGLPFTAWWQASFHMSANYHNIAGMLTESASANWADPIYILPDQLSGTRGRPQYKPQMSMPRLWPGGWWRLRDIVEQKIIASKAVLELGARYKKTMLRNMVLKAKGNTDLGKSHAPYAFVLPYDQHDFLTAVKLARTFQENGVEVHRLEKDYQMGSRLFRAGSLVISCAQPMRAFIVSFLEQVDYPDNYWTREHTSGDPLRPYDLTGYSMSEHMGVEAVPFGHPTGGMKLTKIDGFVQPPPGTVKKGEPGTGTAFIFHGNYNDSFKAVNRLQKEGVTVYRATKLFRDGGKVFHPGSFIVKASKDLSGLVSQLAQTLGVDFFSLSGDMPAGVIKLKQPRLGLYKRYAGGNMDEGWTAWLLKDFEFSFHSLFNKDVQNKKKMAGYDVIVIPSDSYETIVKGRGEKVDKKTPPQYRGGIGESGEVNVKSFVEKGGTLVVLNGAYHFAQKVFDLPVNDVVEEKPWREFFCPGATLKIKVDTTHPLGYGMPSDALALFRYSPALRVSAGDFDDKVALPVRYAEKRLLQSGWLIGEKYLTNKPAVLVFEKGKGKIIILAFPAQHRAQMHGTFKFLFNSIFY